MVASPSNRRAVGARRPRPTTRDLPVDAAARGARRGLVAGGGAAVALGHALEFYDFTVYGFFAVPIGRAFFPAASPWTSLLLSVAVFGVGFVARPLGAVVLGSYADRRNRKAAMLAAIALMAAGTLGLAATPGYAEIGVAAPALAVAARLVQGFAYGGETGPSMLYMFEGARPDRNARAVAWLWSVQSLAVTAAGAVGVGLSARLSAEALDAWGWRLALALGLAVVPVGLFLRARLPVARRAAPVRAAELSVAGSAGVLVCAVLVVMSGTVTFYVGAYMVSYASTALKLPASAGFVATVATGLAGALMAPLGGWWADRVGGRSATIAGRLALAAVAVPSFWFLAGRHDAVALASVAALISGLNTFAGPPGFCLIIEALPTAYRATGLAVAYALGVSLFGGTTQFVLTALIAWTGDPSMPGYYLAAASLISVGAALAIRRRDDA